MTKTKTPSLLRSAGFATRVLAWCVDAIPFCVLAVVLYAHPFMALAAIYILRWFYYTGYECCQWQGTPGKRLCGLVVVDALTFETLTFRTASRRYFFRLLSIATCGLGFMPPLLSLYRPTLHDRLAGTTVITL